MCSVLCSVLHNVCVRMRGSSVGHILWRFLSTYCRVNRPAQWRQKQVEKSVRCECQSISKNKRNGAQDSGEMTDIVWLSQAALRKIGKEE